MRPFGSRELTRMATTHAAGILQSARAQHVGPELWTVSGATGDGMSGPVYVAPVGTLAGWVVSPKDITLVQAQTVTTVAQDTWHLYAATDQIGGGSLPLSLATGMILSANGYRFRILGIERMQGYLHAPLQEA